MTQKKWSSLYKQSWKHKCTKIESLGMKIRLEEHPLSFLPVPCTAVLVQVHVCDILALPGRKSLIQPEDLVTQKHDII